MPITPTPSQLQSAFAAIRRADWPTELDAALAHGLYGRLVRMHASLLARGLDVNAGLRTVYRPTVQAPEPPHSAEPAPAPRPAQPPKPRKLAVRVPVRAPVPQAAPAAPLSQPSLFDRKRAAAGDRDD